MKYSFLIISQLILVLNVYSQVQQEWVARYNGMGNGEDKAYCVVSDEIGNIYVTGRAWNGGNNGSHDVITIKYGPGGNILWMKTYNGSANNVDDARIAKLDNDGNLLVAGWTCGNSGCFEGLLIKYNPNGIELWAKTFSYNNGGGAIYDISIDDFNNVYAAGETYNQENKDYLLLKYSSSGVLKWAKVYNGTSNGDDIAYSVAVGRFGSVYLAGGSNGTASGMDYCALKLDTTGAMLWIKRYDGPSGGEDVIYGMTIDGFDNVYVTGKSYFGGDLGFGSVTIKYYENGNFGWFNSYNGPGNISESKDATHFIDIDEQSNVYVTGWSGRFFEGYDYTTISYTRYGSQRWINFYGDTSRWWDSAWDIEVDGSNSVYITGGSQNGGESSEDFATVRYDNDGNQIWVARYDGPGNSLDIANSITVDDYGNVYVTGWSTGGNSGLDFCTIKYSQLNGVTPVSTEIPQNFTLHQNYPNPFNPSTKIKFEVPAAGNVAIRIFDVLGREVGMPVNEYMKPGVYETDFDVSDLPSGVYYYKLDAGEFSETKKMILLK